MNDEGNMRKSLNSSTKHYSNLRHAEDNLRGKSTMSITLSRK